MPPAPKNARRYWAFISYSHRDERWAAWLHRKIEGYRGHAKLTASASLRNEPLPPRLFPVFRDREELAGAPDLSERIQEALRESRYLIVICSPHAAGSRWVNEEIKAFKALGGEARVLALIVDGEPNGSDDPRTAAAECFPDALRRRIGPDGTLTDERTEPIAADARKGKDGERHAMLKIIAGILGVRFDDLRRRDHERAVRRRNWITGGSLAAAAVFAGIAGYAYWQRLLAEERSRVALSRQLAAQALNELPGESAGGRRSDYARALLLGVRALQTKATMEARSVLLKAMLVSPHRVKFLWPHAAPIVAVAFSEDGNVFASGSEDGRLVLWDAATQQPLGDPLAVPELSSLALSLDGKVLATGSRDSMVRLWDPGRRQPIGEPLRGSEQPVLALAFSRDGRMLAAGGGGATTGAGELFVWDLAGQGPLRSPMKESSTLPHHRAVVGVAFSPDGKTLASASVDGTLAMWEIGTLQARWVQEGHEFASIAFSHDGRWLASGGRSGTGTRRIVRQPYGLIVWDVASGAARGLVPPQVTDNVRSVAFDRNGLLASGDPDGRVLIWSNPGDETPEARPLWGHGAAITALAFSADGTRLLSGSADGAVLWRDVRGGQPLEMVIDDREGRAAGAGNPFFRIAGLALSPDGRTSAAQRGRAIGLWDTASGAPRPSLPVKAAGDASMAFTPDGKILAVAGGDGVTLWDVARREVVGSPVQHKTEIDGRSISPDGTIIAIRQPDRAVLLWDIAARRASGNLLTGHQADLTDLAFSPNGKALASGAKDGVVTVWDVAGRRPLRAPLEGHDGRVEGLRFSPDGRALAVIASGNQTSTVTLWDLKRSARAELLSKRRVRPATLLFSPDGKTLVTAAERRSPERRDVESDLLLWDVANLQAPATSLRGHDAPIVEFAFAAEGDSLVSVDEKRTVILWDVARRVSIGRLVMGHPQGVRSAAFDRDASRMLSSGLWGASLIVTDWRPRSWATYACQAANRDLNPDEWRRIAGAEFPYQAACPPPPGPD